MKKTIFLCVVIVIQFSCRTDAPIQNEDFTINVRIHEDPQRINPIFSTNTAAREIFPYIFLQLAEFDPKTLELSPILATEIPSKQSITSGTFAGGESYTFEILEEAIWSDGSPILASDYLFTFKAVSHPAVNANSWKSYLNQIAEVQLNESNPKQLTVIFAKPMKQGLEIASSIEFFPEHIYDPKGVLATIPLADLRNPEKHTELESIDGFNAFATQFNDVRFQQDNCTGSGPYTLDAWETDQFIKISRKENWWGDKFPERTFLQAEPKTIIFNVIPDEITAITQLKSGQIDFMTVSNGENFKNLMSENPELNFHTPQLTHFYYIGMNNKSPKLSDKRVRRAISHLVDVDGFIEQMEYGKAQRTVGVILPFREEYNSDLKPIELDVEKAKELLDEAGWKDTNGDGIRDKIILGQRVELVLDMFVTSGLLGQRLALFLNEKAKPIGIGMNTVQKTNRTIVADHLNTGDYDLYPMIIRSAVTEYDPYTRWHSDNATLGGRNVVQYVNPEADRLIEELQKELNAEKRIQLYAELQAIMYEDQPAVFLYSPLAKLVSSPRIEPLISVKRPGYFLQTANVNEFSFSEN